MVHPLVSGVLLTLTESVGDFSLKTFSNTGSKFMLGLGMSIYLVLAGLLAWLFQFNGIAITNSFWDATSNIMTMFIGKFMFNESYTTRQWIGMGIVSLGIALMY